MIEKELSEPYPIYTYRYFVHKWPELTLMAYFEDQPDTIIGCIVSKLDYHQRENSNKLRGYIAMLAVDPN
jgi:peptide alpha-N-acetyltransferase